MSNSSKNEAAKMTNNCGEMAADELKQVVGGMGFGPMAFQVAAICRLTIEDAILNNTIPFEGPAQCVTPK